MFVCGIRLPIIFVSARVSKRVLCAHSFRGQHGAHKSGFSFSKKLQVVKSKKRGVAIFNRTFTAMHPLEM